MTKSPISGVEALRGWEEGLISALHIECNIAKMLFEKVDGETYGITAH